MRDLILLFVHVLATSIRLARPGGVRSVLAESGCFRDQLLQDCNKSLDFNIKTRSRVTASGLR
jgi:hypothetical protein